MDRIETYVGQSILEWCFSKPDQNKMVALAKLTAAVLGTSTIANGLACTATGPASMFVNIGAGELYQSANLENTACGTLPQDLAHQIMKQGILLDTLQVPNANTGVTALTAPGSSGQSINYLVEATYSDSDVSIDPTTGATNVVLPFYNSSNPQTPYNGPGNTGASSNTFRKGVITFTVKAGAAATTGTQTTPAPDAGYVGLWVVTVPFGAVTLTSTNIAAYPGQPILPSSLLASIQNGNLSYAVATGTANAHVAAFTPVITARTDGMLLRYKAPAANTGALTLNDGLGAVAVVGANHAALQGGETITNGDALVMWNSSIGGGSYILLECTGGALQIAPATQSQHAVQYQQIPQIQPISASVASNALTATLNPTMLAFRSATLGSGTVTSLVINSALSLTVPSGATLGTTNGAASTLAVLAINNGGTVQIGIVNLAGGVSLDEGTLVSATAITSGSTSAATIYSSSAASNCPFRVVGFITATEATAGTWATAPSTVQGASMSFLGFGANGTGAGYQKFPNGVIIQWSTTPPSSSSGDVVALFPLTFPNSVYSVTVSANNGGQVATMNSPSTGGFNYSSYAVGSATRTAGVGGLYIAIGR